PTIEHAESFLSPTTASAEITVFNPLKVHVFAVVTIALLEFTDLADNQLSQSAWVTLGKVHRALEQLSERAHADAQERFAGEGPGVPALYWADGLLRMIDAKPRITGTSEGGNETNSRIEAAPN